MELDALYGVPLETARKTGCSMPKVQTLYYALRFIDARNASQQVALDSIATTANGRGLGKRPGCLSSKIGT
jgi:hypothetical protein